MEYNSHRDKMVIPEYGRNVQKMIEYTKTIEDREKRTKSAEVIVRVMMGMNPQIKGEQDYLQTLWDHLFIISEFDLDVDSPFPMPEKEILRRRRNADDKIVRALTLQETGLWSEIPEQCWELETRIIKKQEYAFRLIAPDEEAARAQLLSETPQKASGRKRLLETKGGQAPYLSGWKDAVEQS